MAEGIESTFGALLIGVLVSAIAFGGTNLQVYWYFTRYSNDRMWIKGSVCYLWMLDALCVALSSHVVYYNLVIRCCDHSRFLSIVWSWKAQNILSGIIISSVQVLYTVRIWLLVASTCNLSYSVLCFPGMITFFVFAGCVSTVVASYEMTDVVSPEVLLRQKWTSYYLLSLWIVTDLMIAGYLCYLIHSKRTGWHRSDRMIMNLVFYTINGGFCTSLGSLSAIIATVIGPHTFAETSAQIIVTKVYVNSFLALLNARESLRDVAAQAENTVIVLHPLNPSSPGSRYRSVLPREDQVMSVAVEGSDSGVPGAQEEDITSASSSSHRASLRGKGDKEDNSVQLIAKLVHVTDASFRE